MAEVRFFLDEQNLLWTVARCALCGETHNYLIPDLALGPVRCKSCDTYLDIEGDIVKAILRLPMQ